MIQLRSVLTVADNSGAKRLRVILVHGGWKRPLGRLADVVTAAVIDADPQGQVRTGEVVKAVVVRTSKEKHRQDGSWIKFDDNAAVIIDGIKTKNPRGTRIFGPVAREVKEKGFSRIASLATEVV